MIIIPLYSKIVHNSDEVEGQLAQDGLVVSTRSCIVARRGWKTIQVE